MSFLEEHGYIYRGDCILFAYFWKMLAIELRSSSMLSKGSTVATLSAPFLLILEV
jgi:hypothetical protein